MSVYARMCFSHTPPNITAVIVSELHVVGVPLGSRNDLNLFNDISYFKKVRVEKDDDYFSHSKISTYFIT